MSAFRKVLIAGQWCVETRAGVVIGRAHILGPAPVHSEAERIQSALLARPADAPVLSRLWRFLTKPIH